MKPKLGTGYSGIRHFMQRGLLPRVFRSSDGILETTNSRVLVVAHAILLVLVTVPFFLVDIPALADYPNHLARMGILAELKSSLTWQALYETDWGPAPNLAMELTVPSLSRWIGLINAGRIFLILTLLITIVGTAVLQRVVLGEVGLASLFVYPVLFNYVFFFGFVNYLFGIGLSLLLLSFWITSEGWSLPARCLISSTGALVLFFCHLSAFAVGILGIGMYESWRWWNSQTRWSTSLLPRGLAVGVQVLIPFGILLSSNPVNGVDSQTAYSLSMKLIAVVAPTLFYEEVFDYILFGTLITLLAIVMVRGRIHYHPTLILPSIGLAVSVLVVPTWLLGNWGNDFRLAVPLVLILISGCRLDSTRFGFVCLVVIILTGARVINVSNNWLHYDGLFDELRSAGTYLEPGARVLPAMQNLDRVGEVAPNDSRRVFYNVAALLALEREVFVPNLFTAKGRQPLVVRPDADVIDVPYMLPMHVGMLTFTADPRVRDYLYRNRRIGYFDYRFVGWWRTFDYVLVLDFGEPENPMPTRLTPFRRGSYFTIYAISS